MNSELNLDRFYDWVCEMNATVREMEETLERVRAWGVASVCWQVKLNKIHADLHKLRLDVANCKASRQFNRTNLIGYDKPAAPHRGTDPANVIPFIRAGESAENRKRQSVLRKQNITRP